MAYLETPGPMHAEPVSVGIFVESGDVVDQVCLRFDESYANFG